MNVQNHQSTNWDFVKLIAIKQSFLPLELALERMKIEAQKNPQQAASFSIKKLWQEKGIKGLYEGGSANIVRRISREWYQPYFILSFNKFCKDYLPENHRTNRLATDILTGIFVAGFVQAGITLPLERIFIEKTAKEGYSPFFKKLQNKGFFKGTQTLYEGFQTTLIRHSITWTTFNLSNHAASHLIKKANPDNKHPNLTWFVKGLLLSTVVVGVAYPIEMIRNRVLMDPAVLSRGTIGAIKNLYKVHGIRNLYRGAPIVWGHNCIQMLFMQTFFEKMNKR